MDDRYDKVLFGDSGSSKKVVDKYTAAALEEAERRLGYTLTIVQGSYNAGGVSASSGTHDGGGTVDLTAHDHERKVRVLRSIGFAVWYRPAIKGLWNAHCHAVLIGNAKLAPAAARQVESYRRGRDGLKGDNVDPTWRPNPIPQFKYPEPPPPSRVTLFRAAVEEALADIRPHIKPKQRPAADRMLAAIAEALEKGPRA